MRQIPSARIAAIVLSVGLLAAYTTVAFADPAIRAEQQVPPARQSQANSYDPSQSTTSNFSPYDSPDFVLKDSDIHS